MYKFIIRAILKGITVGIIYTSKQIIINTPDKIFRKEGDTGD